MIFPNSTLALDAPHIRELSIELLAIAMPQCSVFDCKNVSGEDRCYKGNSISYHRFPTAPKLRRTWIIKISRKEWAPTKNAVVCSCHFSKEDFEEDMVARIMGTQPHPKLKPGAVPSLLLRGEKRIVQTAAPATSGSSKVRRMSAYLSHREDIEQEECVKKLLCCAKESLEEDVTPPIELKTANVGVHVRQETLDKKIQVRPSTRDAAVQSQSQTPSVSVSVQTDLTCFDAYSFEENFCEEDMSTCSSCSASVQLNDFLPPDSNSESEDDHPDESEDEKLSNATSPHIFLTFVESINELLKFCPACGSPSQPESRRHRFDGGMLCVTTTCLKGCNYSWTSQPTLSRQSARSGSGDFQLAASFVLCGGTYALLKAVSDSMRLGIVSAATYHQIQHKFVAPVVFSAWAGQQHVILQELCDKTSVRLAGDSRCDSPGFSAKYSTYTLLDCDSGYVVCGRVVQLGQETNSSVAMEKVGLQSCLDFVLNHGVSVTVLATDRSPSVIKKMKNDYSDIDHQYDIWHLAKSLKKNILAVSRKKSTSVLNEWVKSIINHLYYSAQNCNEDPDTLIELWLSELNHITGVHQWKPNARFKEVLSCSHDDVDSRLAAEGFEKVYLDSCSDAFRALERIVSTPQILEALRHCTLALSTASLENLHSVILKYAPKRLHFGPEAMNLRTCLAYLDHNNNIRREKKLNTFKYQYSKVSGKWIARPFYEQKSYSWRKDLLLDAVTLRCFGILPPDCEAPFSNIAYPSSTAPVPMPNKEDLKTSRTEHTRHV